MVCAQHGGSNAGGGAISGALGAWSATLTETTLRRMRNRLGEAIMEMPFALVEEPRVRDFISLAKEEAKFSEILTAWLRWLPPC